MGVDVSEGSSVSIFRINIRFVALRETNINIVTCSVVLCSMVRRHRRFGTIS
jgi:hypothetical protein